MNPLIGWVLPVGSQHLRFQNGVVMHFMRHYETWHRACISKGVGMITHRALTCERCEYRVHINHLLIYTFTNATTGVAPAVCRNPS